MAKIFVSYAISDRAWASWISNELEALGHRATSRAWETRDLVSWSGHDQVLLLLSDEYWQAASSALQRHFLLWMWAEKQRERMLVVAVEPSGMPLMRDEGVFKSFPRCDLWGIPKDAARMRFRKFMEEHAAPQTAEGSSSLEPPQTYEVPKSGRAVVKAPQTPEGPTSVFVSHSNLDRDWIESEIIPVLTENRIRPWISEHAIATSTQWEREILKGMQACQWFSVVASPSAATSDWVKDELSWAVQNRPTRIVTIIKEKVDLYELHIRLPRFQYIDYTSGRTAARQKLLAVFVESA